MSIQTKPKKRKIQMQNTKQTTIQSFLSFGKILVLIDGTKNDVILPTHLQHKDVVRITLSSKYPNPIIFTDDGIQTKLSFGGRIKDVFIPYHSIYGVLECDNIDNFMYWENEFPIKLRDFAKQLGDLFDSVTENTNILDFNEELKKLKS
jgi:hypothetical protein